MILILEIGLTIGVMAVLTGLWCAKQYHKADDEFND